MGYWLKLYTDVLDDPKYFRLSEEAKLGMYELMLVAKKVEGGELTGNLPTIDDIAFHTRKTREHWEKILPELESIGFVVIDGDTLKVKNYVKRQGAIPAETRVKQYRRKRNDGVMADETEMKRECNGLVTNRNGEKIREEKNKNKKQSTEKIREESFSPNQLFIQKFIDIIPHLFTESKQPERVMDLVGDYGEEKVLEVARWASKNARSMEHAIKSIEGAIRNWQFGERNNESVFEEWINGNQRNCNKTASTPEQASPALQTHAGNT